MGGSHNKSGDASVPAGGAFLEVQPNGCFVKPSFSREKPASLAMIPDKAWSPFADKVGTAVDKLWTEKTRLIGLVFVPFVLLPRLLLPEVNLVGVMPVLALAILFLPMWFVARQNATQDNIINQACIDLTQTAGVSAEYRTKYTGLWRPKGSSPFRGIAIIGQAIEIQAASVQVSVVCPAGVGPGGLVSITTPSGQQATVNVPAGVSAGQQFTVQVQPSMPLAEGFVIEGP